jgi:hypothetical protein
VARLPDASEIKPSIGMSGRPIATYDTTGYARGAAAMAQGAKDIGTGLTGAGNQVASVANQQKAKDDEFESASARAEYQVAKINYLNSVKDDPDYATLPERSQQNLTMFVDGAANRISDPRRRAMFKMAVADDTASAQARVIDLAQSRSADAGRADLREKLEGLRQGALLSESEEERGKAIQTANDLITAASGKNFLTKEKAVELQRGWATDYAKAWLENQPAEERVRILRPQASMDQVVDRIIGVESGGKPNARNPKSSAYGAGQFINSTWLSLIKETRPDIAQGRSDAELLELRGDPRLSRDMVAAYAQKNGAYLKAAGVEPTPGNVYLAHFLGPDGAARVLQADPNKPVAEIVGPDAVRANPSILGGKTAGTVAAWAGEKMGDNRNRPKLAEIVPADQAMQLYRRAETEVAQKQVVASVARGEEYERSIVDAAAGKGDLPNRAAIENDPILTEPARNTMLRMYDKAAGDVATWQATWSKFTNPNGGSFNPYDADERKSVDTLYQHLGGNAPALQAVVDRTNILPKSAATAMRGDFVSSDPKRVAQSLSVASNLLAKNQNIFVGVDGQKDFENNAVAFRHYVDDLGMTADDAAKKIVYQQSSEYQSSVKARLKGEDVDAKLKKELSVDDISDAFDQSWLPFTDPKVGYTPESRLAMYGQYSEQVKERYLEHGDWGRAKKEAAGTLGKSWGVTRVNGAPTVVPYAPERAPVMAGIENPSDVIATGAINAVKDAVGYEPARKSLQFIPVPGVTPAAYKAGQPVPYILKWEDANGQVQMSQKHFLIDGKDARAAQTGQRQTQFGKAAAGAAVNSEMRDVTPDPLRQYGFN